MKKLQESLPSALLESKFGKMVAVATLLGTLAACSGPGSTDYMSGGDVRGYVAREIQAKRVRSCVGDLTVKKSGNVRTEPVVTGGFDDSDNVALGGISEFDTVEFHNPMRVNNTEYGEVDKHWYMGLSDSGKPLFVNENAANITGLDCSATADVQDLPGNVTVSHPDIAILDQK